ncbi:DUF2603 domain-containing protein [Campylobacter sp. MIT 21-1685]|uniref:DUF2603 domain-containing protein n=1 Tax=unclassified Campylobacter TaxID=2593542 RepID=UPI00224B69B6|nr:MULTISPECIES: DUF2603 domain-containing protein [unclassified Campylobacter]MCX2683113.1 DUF2603 domain-containing protein [Campylobacter sp. MIT 21-1684]MCX2751427.1 DUF2603 domain-containing protein [Campylobacter sp. MIT 21-1682]MCX2807627.1 DUF2603 domain-containing protein [Campylobacter sp. MIT 21-1685]
MKSLQKTRVTLNTINEFAKTLGLQEQTIFELKTKNENEKVLSLKNGTIDSPEPWFLIDEDENVHTMISLHSLKNMLETLKQAQKDNFELRLEKALYQQIPIDFNDAWTVAMDEIKRKAANGLMEINIDLEKLVSDIKKEHPNLFVDMEAMIERVKENERL